MIFGGKSDTPGVITANLHQMVRTSNSIGYVKYSTGGIFIVIISILITPRVPLKCTELYLAGETLENETYLAPKLEGFWLVILAGAHGSRSAA